ncbi:hypothetical protein HU200_049085 [Digitaria exilis]|uniref:Tropinone reductase I n=1 Tax=Digitaria exilis TaxID=1010633 RepID=A0A835E8U1_9POAL|nr:hypothetical protein HU200_049085 [Digitaria exilis]
MLPARPSPSFSFWILAHEESPQQRRDDQSRPEECGDGMPGMGTLAGATALVTGGSKGIGHAIVEELAGLGARVHTCSRNTAELEESCRLWANKGLVITVSAMETLMT